MGTGQSNTPDQDIAAGAMGGAPTLSNYYTGQGGGKAFTDTSGRGFYSATGQSGQATSLADSPDAMAAGLVGNPTPAPGSIPGAVPGAVPPPASLAPSGVIPPGPGQVGDAQAAQSLAQGTGQVGTPPAPGAPNPLRAAPLAPTSAPAAPAPAAPQTAWQSAPGSITNVSQIGGQLGGIPAGWQTTVVDGQNYLVSPDQTTVYGYNPQDGTLTYAANGLPAGAQTLANTAQQPGPVAPAPSTPPPPAPAWVPPPDYSISNPADTGGGPSAGGGTGGDGGGGDGGGGDGGGF